MARYVRQEASSLPWGSTLLVIAAEPSEELLTMLLDLKRVGRSVALVKVGGKSGEKPELGAGDLKVYYISDEDAWNVVKEIGLKQN